MSAGAASIDQKSALRGVIVAAGLFALLNVISFAFGEAPIATSRAAIVGTFGTAYGFGQVLFKATPLIFTGLAFDVALRAGLFNIGAEGQVALAGLVTAIVGAKLPAGTPWPIAIVVCVATAASTGALVAALPAVMRARRGVHEIITTLMMNRIVEGIVPFVLVSVLGASGLRTANIVEGASIPKLSSVFSALQGSAASFAFPLAAVIAFGVVAWLTRARAGREIVWIGGNAEACRAEGVDVRGRLVLAMLISGALAGAAASATVLGYKGYFENELGRGAGFTGVAVALIGRGRPLGIILAALFFGALQQAGLAINARVPKEAMDVLTAAAILLVSASAGRAQGGRAA